MSISEDKLFGILKNHFDKYGFVNLQLDSYNDFVNFGIPRIVENLKKMIVKVDDTKKYVIKME